MKNTVKDKIPVTLITGYLGSGKTTLMNELLKMQSDKNMGSNWVAALPKEEKEEAFANYPEILEDWDETYGDKINQIVFIGKDYSKAEIIKKLDQCLGKYMNT